MSVPRLLSVELVQNAPDIRPVSAAHPHHEIVYILTDGYRVSAKGRDYTGQPGDVFLYPRGLRHGVPFPHDLTIRLWVLKWTGGLDFGKRKHLLKVHDSSGHLLMLLNWMWNLHPAESDADRRLLRMLFRLVLEEHARLGGDVPGTAARRLAHYVVSNLNRPVPLAELAAFAQCSTRQVRRIFLRNLKQTPGQFLQQARAERAVNLLRGSSLSLKEVANAVGLNSRARFHQLIKRHTGQTPGEIKGR